MATIDDYFRSGGEGWCPSVADDTAQTDINFIDHEFVKVLEALGLKKSRNSEWAYGCQCRGVVCEPDLGKYNDCSILSVEPIDPDELSEDECYGCFREVYERHQPRMKAVYDWIVRADEHLSDAPDCYRPYPGLGLCWDYAKKRDRIMNDRRDAMLGEYESLVEKLCEELASECQKLFEDACEYAYSDEAAREWVVAQDDVA